jgi:O-antigen/teichoic acid export membrane protein
MSESSTKLRPEQGGVRETPVGPPHQQSDLRVQVVQNTAATIAGRGLAIVFSAGGAVVLTRFLGSEKLGEYGAIYAYLTLFAWIAAFGFEPVLVREISRERENASDLLHTAIVMSCFLSVGAVGAAILLAPWAGYAGHLRALLIIAGLEYVLTPIRLPALIFQVDMQQWYGATINVVRQGVWFAIIVVLWFLGAPLTYVIVGRVLAAMIESGLIWGCSRRFLPKTGSFLRERATRIFSQSFPIAFTSLLAMIYLRIDQVMLHKMVLDSALGQYVAAVKVSELFEALPASLMLALAPTLSVSVAEPERFRSYTDRAFRYFMVLAAALCVVITAGAGLIVRILFGNEFLPAAPMLAVLIWSEIAVFFSTIVVNVLVAENRQRLLPVPTLIGAAVNVGLNLALIPRYGPVGAAYATLVSYTFAWMLVLLFFKETRAVIRRGLRFALPVTGVALVAVGCARFLFVSEALRAIVAIGLFAVGVGIGGLIEKSDLSYVIQAIRASIGKVS